MDQRQTSHDSFPEQSRDWREIEALLLQQVRSELGDGLRRRLESMDIVQDVLTEVWRTQSASAEVDIRDFRGWLRGVLRNRIRNLADFHSRECRDLNRDGDCGSDQRGTVRPPDEEALAREEHSSLVQCLSNLDSDSRALILLRSFEKLSWQDVAASTGRASADAARMGFARAMVRFTSAFHGARS